MIIGKVIFYYIPVVALGVFSVLQYCSDQVSRACFGLIAMGILLILNEVKRNARIVNNYLHCDFLTSPITSPPHPGPAAPGSPEEGPHGTIQ